MFDFISGKVTKLLDKEIVLDNSGIGYKIFCSSNTSKSIIGKEQAKLFIFLSIKEDSHTLFGFESEKEREIFEAFIATNGIGPKLALDILSNFSIPQLKDCITNERVEILTKTPGLGVKKAKKLIIETKDKMVALDSKTEDSTIEDDIVEALISLGYSKKEISNNLERYESVEEGIRGMLQKLS